MRCLFRVDASLTIGSGHLMRCLTLAQAMNKAGHHVVFACREHDGHLLALISTQGFGTIALPVCAKPESSQQLSGYAAWLGCSEQEDANLLLDALAQRSPQAPDFDWLVVDHYALGAEFCQLMRKRCRTILQIDDLANRPYDCDLLLDQNLLPDFAKRYLGLTPANCRLLLGPNWALLREEFSQQQPRPKTQDATARVLVFFGGSDPDNFTALAINALQQLQKTQWLADIVIGQANPHRLLLQQLCAQDRRLTLHVQTPGMAGLMAAADLMIGAGGATHWERACLGVPAIVVALADNQQATTAYMASLGACVDLGTAEQLSVTRLVTATQSLLQDTEKRLQMSAIAQQLVPAGGGVPKLLDVMQQWPEASATNEFEHSTEQRK